MSEADFSDQALRGEDTPDAPEPETPEPEAPEPEPEPTEAEEQLLAGKYKSPEELERAYNELQQLQGQQSNELGQLRQAVEALNQPDYQPTDAPLPTDETMDAITELVENGRMSWPEAVQWAGTQSPHLHDQVMDSWYEYEPRNASRYDNAQLIDQRHRQLAQEVSPYVQASQEQQVSDRVLDTWRNMAQKYQDFNEVGGHISEAIGANPELAGAASSPDPQTRERAFETLYVLAKHASNSQAEPAAPPPPDIPVNAAKTAAQVATASSTTTRGDTGRQQQINAYLDQVFGSQLSVESGLEKP